MSETKRNVSLLAACQAMLFTNNSTLIAINGLAGLALAPYAGLATLPVTCWVVGGALTTMSASQYMKRVGRQAGLMHGCAIGIGERVGNTPMDQLLVNLKLMGWIDNDLTALPEAFGRVQILYQLRVRNNPLTTIPFIETLPISGMSSWRHFILPVITLGAFQAAVLTRMVRSCMVDALGKDYIVTARAKGAPEFLVVFKHALRNALIPILTGIVVLRAHRVGLSLARSRFHSYKHRGLHSPRRSDRGRLGKKKGAEVSPLLHPGRTAGPTLMRRGGSCRVSKVVAVSVHAPTLRGRGQGVKICPVNAAADPSPSPSGMGGAGNWATAQVVLVSRRGDCAPRRH